MSIALLPSGSAHSSAGPVTAQEIRSTIAVNLKRLREAAGLTQGQLGARAAMPKLMISHFECARRVPCTWSLVRLCRALGAASDEVLGMRKPLPPFWGYQDATPVKVDAAPVNVGGTAANDGAA